MTDLWDWSLTENGEKWNEKEDCNYSSGVNAVDVRGKFL